MGMDRNVVGDGRVQKQEVESLPRHLVHKLLGRSRGSVQSRRLVNVCAACTLDAGGTCDVS